MKPITVIQLAEGPQHLPVVGTWIYETWWRRPDNTAEVVFRLLRTHDRLDEVPFTVVALAGDTPVGSCCVVANDCVHRPQYTPWVAAVYVQPQIRRRGVASKMLQALAAIASRAGLANLYIDCLAATAPVYERNGWQILEREVGDPHSVVLSRPLTGPLRPAQYPRSRE
jgi:GNAT superfamily N-acetyltransferase